ncbi:MAG: iron chelate uptake ABC transporter family permease subunit [Proteobacteria bacterium]|nr:iron chelate uptake ABC transporter family permease subunit [Pseudomonadota bacterium]
MNKSSTQYSYRLWQALLVISPLLALLVSLAAGSLQLSWNELFNLLLHGPGDTVEQVIIWQIRLPRALLAGLVGAALSLSGTTFQAVLRNPLADPYLLGVSGGAALGLPARVLIAEGQTSAPFIGAAQAAGNDVAVQAAWNNTTASRTVSIGGGGACGDTNGDGVVTLVDVARWLRAVSGLDAMPDC